MPIVAKDRSGEAERSVIRRHPAARAGSRGLAGAASGRPISFACSITTGQTVRSWQVRSRSGSPRTASVSIGVPRGTSAAPFASLRGAKRTVVIDGTGASRCGDNMSSSVSVISGSSSSRRCCTRAARNATPSSSRSTCGSSTVPSGVTRSRPAIFGNASANSPASFLSAASSSL